MLDRSNYTKWVMLMQCNLKALEVWHLIDPGTNVKWSQDRQASRRPKDMWQSLGSWKIVKEAWEVVQTMRLSADRVKEVNAQRLLKEFENIGFKEGETIKRLRYADHQPHR